MYLSRRRRSDECDETEMLRPLDSERLSASLAPLLRLERLGCGSRLLRLLRLSELSERIKSSFGFCSCGTKTTGRRLADVAVPFSVGRVDCVPFLRLDDALE